VEGWKRLVEKARRIDPIVWDAGLALVLLGLTITEIALSAGESGVTTADLWWSSFFMVTQALPLTFRRRAPFTTITVVGISVSIYNALNIPPQPFTEVLIVVVAFYSVAAYARRDLMILAGVLSTIGLVVGQIPFTDTFKNIALIFVLSAASWLLGLNTRYRLRQEELLQERAERAEREREERARVAALEERARIARELHDVVAHTVSVMAVQAGAARKVLDGGESDEARRALASIEEASREAMAELRRLLGVLREPDEGAERGPQPGLERLDHLVEQFREAGLNVDVREEGDRRPLPAGLDLSAYRVVQEALTNTLKHSGSNSARVLVRFGADALDVEVKDRGGRTPREIGANGGKGVVGMRERVALFGGALEAGPADGGFSVRATFPLRHQEEAEA
jgi:signal transduction histidine kinase